VEATQHLTEEQMAYIHSQQTGQGLASATPPPHIGFNPETCRSLYVGNLDLKVMDSLLFEIFSTVGAVEGCKLIKDKNSDSAGYGFVDYFDHETAQKALNQLNGRLIYGSEIKVNWAFAGGHREDTSTHYHIFVGDLSPEIEDKALYEAFSAFGSISDARVMWDQNTGRSRGYGFVAFRNKEDAQQAITEMNGEWLGSRAIRCNWANQKVSPKVSGPQAGSLDYNSIVNQASPSNTTCYVGNLTPDVTDQMLREVFQDFGYIEEIRIQKDKGYAFVRFQTHESAARAICSVHGRTIGYRNVKCSWGKERAAMGGSTVQPYAYNPYGYGNPYYQQYQQQQQYYYQQYANYAAYYQQPSSGGEAFNQ